MPSQGLQLDQQKQMPPTFGLDQYSTATAPAALLPFASSAIQYIWYVNFDTQAAPLSNVTYAPLKAVDASTLDQKMDDAGPNSGWFRSYNSGAGTTCFSGGWNYNESSNTARCIPYFLWNGMMAGDF